MKAKIDRKRDLELERIELIKVIQANINCDLLKQMAALDDSIQNEHPKILITSTHKGTTYANETRDSRRDHSS